MIRCLNGVEIITVCSEAIRVPWVVVAGGRSKTLKFEHMKDIPHDRLTKGGWKVRFRDKEARTAHFGRLMEWDLDHWPIIGYLDEFYADSKYS